MNKIESHSFILDDEKLIRVKMFLLPIKSDKVSIIFKSNKNIIPIVSTSHGLITSENNIDIKGVCEYLQVFIHSPESPDCECIVSFFNQGLIHSESIQFKIDNLGIITTVSTDFEIIKSSGKSFKAKMSNFQKNISSSKWNVFLSIEEDIVVNIRSPYKRHKLLSISDDEKEITVNDLIFKVNYNTKKIFIPKEWIIKMNLQNISCYEIIKPDFIKLDNMYSKRQVSNTIDVSGVEVSETYTILTPTNSLFDDSWNTNELGLPEYKG